MPPGPLLPLVALAVVAVGWVLTGTTEPSGPSPTAPAFSFVADRLGPPGQSGGWGPAAGVALFDLDGGIVSDDVCLTDPRRGGVTVAPVPGTHGGYRPFRLTAPGPRGTPTGCLPADLDEDGRQDLVVSYRGRSPSLFVRLPGTRPSAAAFGHHDLLVRPQPWNTAAVTVGDFDGDGHLDLVVGDHLPPGGAVRDTAPDARDGGGVRLYLGTGTGAFAEAKDAFGEAGRTGRTLALGVQDLDGDGLPELYVVNALGPDVLLVNESAPGRAAFRTASGTRGLTTPRSSVLGRDSSTGTGVAFTDLDADGTQDILVGSGPVFVSTALPGLRERLHAGEAPYENRAEESGLGGVGPSWDVRAADLDNDGHDEIMYAVEAPGGVALFAGGADGRHTGVAGPVAPGGDATALAVGDVDDDGRLDVAVSGLTTPATLYRNHGVTAPFVGLRPRLPTGPCGATNGGAATGGMTRPAIGAEARLRLPGGGTLARQLYPASSAPELLLGLGEADAGPITLSWRDECGVPRTTALSLDPGWHDLLLTSRGVSEMRRR